MPHPRRSALVALLALASLPVFAAEPIRIAEVVPYRDGVGSAAMRAECDWNRVLSEEIVRRSKGRVVATDADLSTLSGPVLKLSIVNVHAAGGGGFSGPKWGVIRGELVGTGKAPMTFELRRTTSAGMSFSACGSMAKVGRALAVDVVEWLDDPTSAPPATAAD